MNATRRPFIWLITLRQINNYLINKNYNYLDNYLYGFNFREF
jgi:hypothetical protein